MPYTQQQLQSIIEQMSGDLALFNTMLNGDALTTITLSDGTVLPSIAKTVQDAVDQIKSTFLSSLQANLGKITKDLLGNMHPIDVYSLVVGSAQLGRLVQITLSNLVGVNKVEINGLEQDPAGDAYYLSGTTISIPIATGLQLNDTVDVFYYTSQ